MSTASRPVTPPTTATSQWNVKNARLLRANAARIRNPFASTLRISIIKIRKWPVSANHHFLFHSSVVAGRCQLRHGCPASYCPFSIHFSDNLSFLENLPSAGLPDVSIDYFSLPTRIVSIVLIVNLSFQDKKFLRFFCFPTFFDLFLR